MNTPAGAAQSLRERVETLERENRRIKRIGIAAALLVVGLGFMGQAAPSRTIEAQRFVLKDESGIARATLGMDLEVPQLQLYDSLGKSRVSLSVDALGQPALTLYDGAGNQTVNLVGMADGPGFWLSPGASKRQSIKEVVKQKGGIGLYMGKEGPAIEIEDTNGFSTVVGSFPLVTPRTGETHHTSAASLLLFDKDGKVLWSAP